MSDELMNPVTSPQVKSDGSMTFGSCLQKLILGERCRRMAWEDKEVYIVVKDDKLMIFRSDDKRLHPLTVSVGDIEGNDWVVVGKQEDMS